MAGFGRYNREVMPMNKVGSYGAYQANSYDSTLKNQKSRQSKKQVKMRGQAV